MGRPTGRMLDNSNGMQWILPRMVIPTSIESHHTFAKKIQSERPAYLSNRNTIPLDVGCNRNDGPKPSLFRFESFFDSKEKWKVKAGYRFTFTKPTCKILSFQDGRNRTCEVAGTTGGFYGNTRLKPSVLSYFTCSKPKKIFRF